MWFKFFQILKLDKRVFSRRRLWDKQFQHVDLRLFSATMEVKEDFFMYKGGVYRSSLPANFLPPNHRKTGFHSVKILGCGLQVISRDPVSLTFATDFQVCMSMTF